MRTLSRLAMAMALIFAMPAYADDAHHPEKTAAEATNTAPASTKAQAPAATVKAMQGNVKKMQAQLDRMGKAKTDAERQQVMAEHMQTLRENMMLAKGMQSGMMDCEPMHGGGMMKPGAGAGGDQSAPALDRMQQLEKRMDMMERMMQPQDAASAAAPAK